jgi:hypothetical protein
MQLEKQKDIIKKAHQVGSSMVVTIDPVLVKKLKITATTFLSQEATADGLLMRVKKFA